MDVALHVCLCVVDNLVNVVAVKTVVADKRIGEHIGAAFHVLADNRLKGLAARVRDMDETDLAGVAIEQTHHDCLTRSAGAGNLRLFVFVHVASKAANESLVSLNLATRERIVIALLHREPNPMVHEPRGFLCHAEPARHLVAADTVLAVRDKPHCWKPLIEPDWGVLEDRSDLERGLCAVVSRVAFPQARLFKVRDLLRLARWATNLAIRPAHFDHEALAVLEIGKVLDRLLESPWSVHAPNIANESWSVKYISALIRVTIPLTEVWEYVIIGSMSKVNREFPRRSVTSESTYSRMEFERQFPDDAACLDWLAKKLYPNGICCPRCKAITKHHRESTRPSYACQNCGHHEHPMKGTIFEDSATSLKLWFLAIFIMSATRCGISAKQLEREIGVTYKCAWRMFNRIRSLLDEDGDGFTLSGNVELDESHYGGLEKNKAQQQAAASRHRRDGQDGGIRDDRACWQSHRDSSSQHAIRNLTAEGR